MNGSIFPLATLERDECAWDDYQLAPTPVEDRDGRLYKREDYFAPLGYGGINGSKLRQCLHLIGSYVAAGGAEGVLTGASLLSPQVSMSALIARHYGLPCTVVLGATKPETCVRHENVAIAAAVGADFEFIPVGFNPALQRAVTEAHTGRPGWYRLCYGITTPEGASDAEVEAFHRLGSAQAENVPDVTTLLIPAGSCNSCVSVLYGLARYRHLHPSLERVILFGVGPTRLQWIEDRLATIERASGVDVAALFRRVYHHHAALEVEHQTDGPLVLEHYDLHSTGFATYQDRMPFALDGIEFHPTYEGKVLSYMAARPAVFASWFDGEGDTLFWIVGSAPSRLAMRDALLFSGVIV